MVKGNFGSVDGDSAAAMRYTEVRMQKLTHEILADLEKILLIGKITTTVLSVFLKSCRHVFQIF